MCNRQVGVGGLVLVEVKFVWRSDGPRPGASRMCSVGIQRTESLTSISDTTKLGEFWDGVFLVPSNKGIGQLAMPCFRPRSSDAPILLG